MRALLLLEAVRDRLVDHGGDRGPPNPGYYALWQEDDRPCLWKNRELVRYLNGALRDLGLRAPLSDTATLPLVGGQRQIAIPTHWLAIDAVTRAVDGEPVLKTTLGELQHVDRWYREGRGYLRDDGRRPIDLDWRVVVGMPRYYLLDERAGFLTLFPFLPPNTLDALVVGHTRTYSADLRWERLATGTNPTVEIDAPDHYFEALVAGVCARAYRKHDPDTYSEREAAQAEAEFTARVGPLPSFATLDAQSDWAGGIAEFVPNTRFFP